MIALDMTSRVRPGKEKAEELVARIHEAGRLALADISTYEEGMARVAGSNMQGTGRTSAVKRSW